MKEDPFGLIGDLLTISLSAAVPLRIMEYKQRDGPTEDDYTRVRAFAWVLGEKGDILQFRGAKKGETAEVFNGLADALAVLSFCPGGVKFRGEHWEANPQPQPTDAKGPEEQPGETSNPL